MAASSDQKVQDFYCEYAVPNTDSPSCATRNTNSKKADVLNTMAAGQQNLGFINPIVNNPDRAPMPCNAVFQDNQMLDLTDDIEQCVKVIVSTVEEYFVILAASQEDKSSWIYLHQSQNTLCMHKMDKSFQRDEIGECASKYKKMTSGLVDKMVEELYFCMFKKGNLLTVSVARPSFSRQDREAATTILSHTMIQSTKEGGQFIMPRYYAVGSGVSNVYVRPAIRITKIMC